MEFCYGGLITSFLRDHGIEEVKLDMIVARHPDLTGKLVDVTRIKALDTYYMPILLAPDRQDCNDNAM